MILIIGSNKKAKQLTTHIECLPLLPSGPDGIGHQPVNQCLAKWIVNIWNRDTNLKVFLQIS